MLVDEDGGGVVARDDGVDADGVVVSWCSGSREQEMKRQDKRNKAGGKGIGVYLVFVS